MEMLIIFTKMTIFKYYEKICICYIMLDSPCFSFKGDT